ncbi:MAG: PQQ-dependent dehydrogenase, methanol/ethanol family, partial [Hyphomicrobium sp.]
MILRHPRMGGHRILLAAASTLALAAAAGSSATFAAGDGTKPVAWEDILNDEKTTGDVVSWGMGVRNHRYSSLEQINVNNIDKLKPSWSFSFGDEKQRGQETQALVHDGVIYVTASYSRV